MIEEIRGVDELFRREKQLCGFYRIAEFDYHNGPGIGSGGLKRLLQESPAHFKAGKEEKDSKAMAFGSAFHMAVLEPDRFDETYVLKPEGLDLRTKEGKEFAKSSAGKRIISQEDFDTILGMKRRVEEHPALSKAFMATDSLREVTCYATVDGVLVRTRPDLIQGNTIFDLKTTDCAKAEAFERRIFDLGYHVQAALYLAAANSVPFGKNIDNFTIVAVEKKPPYELCLFRLDEEAEDYAINQARTALAIYQSCKQADFWPGYGTGVRTVGVPRYMKGEIL